MRDYEYGSEYEHDLYNSKSINYINKNKNLDILIDIKDKDVCDTKSLVSQKSFPTSMRILKNKNKE